MLESSGLLLAEISSFLNGDFGFFLEQPIATHQCWKGPAFYFLNYFGSRSFMCIFISPVSVFVILHSNTENE